MRCAHGFDRYVLDELWPDEQGDCIDDMNRILANAVLNLACNA